jgi:membrane protein involved in colicin uptake
MARFIVIVSPILLRRLVAIIVFTSVNCILNIIDTSGAGSGRRSLSTLMLHEDFARCAPARKQQQQLYYHHAHHHALGQDHGHDHDHDREAQNEGQEHLQHY